MAWAKNSGNKLDSHAAATTLTTLTSEANNGAFVVHFESVANKGILSWLRAVVHWTNCFDVRFVPLPDSSWARCSFCWCGDLSGGGDQHQGDRSLAWASVAIWVTVRA